MKLLQQLLEAMQGQERAAYNLGKSTGERGKPMAKQEVIEKNMGPEAWKPYSDGYKEGERIFNNKDAAGDERRAKIAAKTGSGPQQQADRRKG